MTEEDVTGDITIEITTTETEEEIETMTVDKAHI